MNGKVTTIATTAVQITTDEAAIDLSFGAEFRYDPADPFAVTMVIESIAGPVHWTFARELITEGQYEPTGDGDVHVWPCLSTNGEAVVIVELCSEDGGTLLQLPSRAVHEFVRSSAAAVPMGSEHVDVDAWIELLLAETATD